MHLDESRMVEQRPDGRDRRVVPLGVARRRSTAPDAAAASIICCASRASRASGFSTSTAVPRCRNGSATLRCDSVGTATVTASTRPSISAALVAPRARSRRPPISRARASLMSTTPPARHRAAPPESAHDASQRPTPITATRAHARRPTQRRRRAESLDDSVPRHLRQESSRPADDRDAGLVGAREHRRRARTSASCPRRPTTPTPRPPASPESSPARRPARRSACPASAWPP